MKRLNYATLKEQGCEGYLLPEAKERVLQFGEGNFMRAFVDYWIDLLNERTGFRSKVVVCQPSSRKPNDALNEQEGLYTLFLRGYENGKKISQKRVISCVSRCLNLYRDYEAFLECAKNPNLRFITCNTTEAGIVYDPVCSLEDRPASSYPGKLTQFMYERFRHFGQERGKGFILLPCELIDDNGQVLKDCVLKYARQWELPEAFIQWIEEENVFCSTLVDRIVTGYPGEEAEALCRELGYEDTLLDTGEVFGFWAIEGPEWIKEELPFDKADAPVLICDDYRPYKQRKVRILNGAHTSVALGAYLAGRDIVRDCMHDEVICRFMNRALQEEIIPTLTLPRKELDVFAEAVTDRFRNPFIAHALLSISLNSTSKWKTRVLPSLKQYVEKEHKLPVCLTASFAFYLAFYRGERIEEGALIGKRGDEEYTIRDDQKILEFYLNHRKDSPKELTDAVCRNKTFWGEDLTKIEGFADAAAKFLEEIEEKGTYEVMKKCLQ